MADDNDSELSDFDASSQTSLKSCGPVLINRVQAFAWSLMQRDRIDDVVDDVVKVFCLKEIVDAKSALWKHCHDEQEVIGKCKRRRDTTERTGQVAHARDLITALQKLDAKDKVPDIAVKAVDLHTMPPLNDMSKGDTCDGLKQQLSLLEAMIRSMHASIQKIENQQVQASSQTKCDATSSMAASGAPPPPLPMRLPSASECQVKTPPRTLRLKHPDTQGHAVNQLPHPKGPTMADMAGMLNDTNERFKEAKAKKQQPPKRRDLIGSGGRSGDLRSGRPRFQVQITNVNPETDAESLKKFLTNSLDGVAPCNVEDTSSKGFETKRFLITFDQKPYDTVLDPAFWPPRIYFRQFHPPRSAQHGSFKDRSTTAKKSVNSRDGDRSTNHGQEA